jgi:hypothetical protein
MLWSGRLAAPTIFHARALAATRLLRLSFCLNRLR